MKKLKLKNQGPIHTSMFSKVSVFNTATTKQNIFIPTSIFVLFLPVHTKTLENDETTGTWDCPRVIHPSSWIDCPIWMACDARNGAFSKQCVLHF